jgi:hypothetical protein
VWKVNARLEYCLISNACGKKRSQNYSAAVSEVPEKAATTAGERTMQTKVRPIRRSCTGEILLLGGLSKPVHEIDHAPGDENTE